MKSRLHSKCNGSSNEIVWFNFHYTQSEEATTIDQYLVCGEHYKTIRNAVAKAVMEAKVDGLDKTCEVCYITYSALGQDSAVCIHVYMGILLLFAFSS